MSITWLKTCLLALRKAKKEEKAVMVDFFVPG